MYQGKSIVVVVPAYNEETQIGKVIETMPDFVDKIVVVDDKSSDNTVKIVEEYKKKDDRIVLICHENNQGVGGAIATGYKWARDHDFDIAVVMAGDGQMDPNDLPAILDPVVKGEADYSKGNRLFTGEAYKKIPKVRYFGNAILSLLTKIASGYWHIADSQSGYTAINKKALHTIDWDKMYKRYGQPNDLLVRLNVYNFRVKDVPVKPVYNIGEKSGIKVRKIIFTISWLLFKLFIWRLKEKYIIRDFHPLVFFYFLGFFLLGISGLFFLRLIYLWIKMGHAPELTALAWMFSFATGLQSTFFAMWFDMEYNKNLK
ncbi:MAG: glycosyltransferase family 2 protein [Thermodesulfobacteriota bacterium]|nr:MAG: glycosyltransferase family 2 protein [Thermodesulfobacteriota bacterium]